MRYTTATFLATAVTLLTSEQALAFQARAVPTARRPLSSTTQRHVVMVEDAAVATSALDTFFETQPYLAAFLTCSIKAGTADFVAQKKLSGGDAAEEHPFDHSRNLSFVFYGGLMQGMFQQFLFSVVYPMMFGHEHTLFTTMQQVAFDVGVMPFVYLPIVYSIKSLFSSGGDFTLETVQDGLGKLVDDIMYKGLLKTYWSIWIPAQCMTFGFVPPHLRVLFVAMVSFAWVTILSSISSSSSSTQEAVPPVVAKPALAALPSADSILKGIEDAARGAGSQTATSRRSRRRRRAYATVLSATPPQHRNQ